ncbi:MAG: SufE family protein [Vampirovibrionales bacterium]
MTQALSLPPSIEAIQAAIVAEFNALPVTGLEGWEVKYGHLIALGKQLEPLPSEYQTEDHLVRGCQSQVWLVTELDTTSDDQPRLVMRADSDALIVKGLVSLLLRVYNRQPLAAILSSPPTFIEAIGLSQQLSLQRSNGLAAMMKQIQFYALAYQLKMQA